MFSCTCSDFLLQHTICKHIHLVAQQRSELSLEAPDFSEQTEHCNMFNDLNITLLKEATPQCLPNVNTLKQNFYTIAVHHHQFGIIK